MGFENDESGCTFAYQVVRRPGYVYVMQSGLVRWDVKIVQLCHKIEVSLRMAKATRVVFDERDKAPFPAWAEAMIWSWMASHARLDRVAFVQSCESQVRRIQERATRAWRGIEMPWGKAVEIAAFLTEHEAVDWVCEHPIAKPA